jgi:diacylglycerol kinase family enzyme
MRSWAITNNHIEPRRERHASDGSAARGTLVDIILNARSGAAENDAVAQHAIEYLAARGFDARVELTRSPAALMRAAKTAADGDAAIVVAAGGDGTVAAVADKVCETGKVLGILPLGTFNYLARRFLIPEPIDEALAVIAAGNVADVGVGEVNGRVFINNSSIGLYPAALKQRETTYRQVGRSQAAAYLSVAMVLLRPPALLSLQLTIDGVRLARRTPLVFAGVNPHQLEQFGISGHDCPEDGRMALYITKPLSAPQLWRLAVRGFFRGLHGAEELEVVCARELVVDARRRRRLRVAMDGEIVRLDLPLRYRFRENALRVLVPAPSDRVDTET